MMNMDNRFFYKNRRVLVTGHTGFKGSWLVMMLHFLGADILGYALKPQPGSLYEQVEGDRLLKNVEGDIRDVDRLTEVIAEFRPEVILHLAAFGFMKECYEDPRRAYSTNVIGSQNILESVRACPSVKSVVMISTDKVYANHGDGRSYKEDDALGGLGPYSASKTCMEYLISDYQYTYLQTEQRCVGIASARASNVLGGGDHIRTRLIPSILEAVSKNQKVELRNPDQTRPWQSVLDALNGYLTIAKAIYAEPKIYSGAWNIGPRSSGIRSVEWIFQEIKKSFRGLEDKSGEKFRINESQTLGLNIEKALTQLDWSPRLKTEEAISHVVEFFQRQKSGEQAFDICMEQINRFYEEK